MDINLLVKLSPLPIKPIRVTVCIWLTVIENFLRFYERNTEKSNPQAVQNLLMGKDMPLGPLINTTKGTKAVTAASQGGENLFTRGFKMDSWGCKLF